MLEVDEASRNGCDHIDSSALGPSFWFNHPIPVTADWEAIDFYGNEKIIQTLMAMNIKKILIDGAFSRKTVTTSSLPVSICRRKLFVFLEKVLN
jgi:hypothetical protein